MLKVKGFTLVEMVMVIIILGIISTVAISRFSDSQSFNTRAVYSQLLATARLAQQTALSRSAVGDVQMQLEKTGNQWVFRVLGGEGFTVDLDAEAEQVRFGTSLSGACSALSSGLLSLVFDGNGNLNPAQNTRLCVSDNQQTLELCISAAGYAYEGNCVL